MVWTDTENNFPWDEKFDPNFKFRQPLLDRDTDFRFFEEKNLNVFTTEQALAGESVLYVYHDIDGDWQFHTNDDPDLDDAKIVCLKDIVAMDPSLNEVHNLKLGWCAFRKDINSAWEYEEYSTE